MQVGSQARKKSSEHPINLNFIGFFCVMLIASTAATQYVAYCFDYHPELGNPLFRDIYPPWSWVQWGIRYQEHFPQITTTAMLLFAVPIVAYGTVIHFLNQPRKRAGVNEGLHGTAEFATFDDVKQTGLLLKEGDSSGIILGAFKDPKTKIQHYLHHNAPENCLITAPPRTGKGVSNIIPTLLSWQHSTVVVDLRGESYAYSAGWRKKYADNVVLKLDLTDPTDATCCFNPIDSIRVGTDYEVLDTEQLAILIVDQDGSGFKGDHWIETAYDWISGLILFAIYRAKSENHTERPSLADIAALTRDPELPTEKLLDEMKHNSFGEGGTVHPYIAEAAQAMLNKDPREMKGVNSTAAGKLKIFSEPILAKISSHSSFHAEDLGNYDKPVSLYIIIDPDHLPRLMGFVRILLNVITSRNMVRPKTSASQRTLGIKRPILVVFDEFPAFGKLDIYEKSLAFMGGFGIRNMIVSQSLALIQNKYSREEGITSSCHVSVVYAPNDEITKRWASEKLGKQTVVKESITTSGKKGAASLRNISKTYQEVARPLLTPDEVEKIGTPVKDDNDRIVVPGEVLIFKTGFPPIRAVQTPFFLDAIYSERAKVEPPEKSDRIHRAKFQQAA